MAEIKCACNNLKCVGICKTKHINRYKEHAEGTCDFCIAAFVEIRKRRFIRKD